MVLLYLFSSISSDLFAASQLLVPASALSKSNLFKRPSLFFLNTGKSETEKLRTRKTLILISSIEETFAKSAKVSYREILNTADPQKEVTAQFPN